MKERETMDYPKIRYHITYDENLTLKDLEELLELIRLSNNDVLQELGVPRSKGNDLQIIENITPGSINLFTILKKILSMSLNCLCEKLLDKIQSRMTNAVELCVRNPQ